MSRSCLYIASQYPISPYGVGGAQALYYEQLAALCELGLKVHLWHFATPSARRQFDSFVASDAATWREVRDMCASVELTTFPSSPSLPVRLRARVVDLVTGVRVENPIYRTTALKQLRRLTKAYKADFIWANHYASAQLSALQRTVPFVYSHHDWSFRIRALRGDGAERNGRRLQEERVVKAASAVVSGSATECEEIRELGCRNTHYIPVAYKPVGLGLQDADTSRPRLVHLGGMNTTANRKGLERFFEIVWPELSPDRPELEVVGGVASAPASLARHLRQVKCHGYVADLGCVLRPYDVFFIPWEYNTGQRTKLPLAFNYAQAVVSTRAAIACFPEAVDGENCRLVDKLGQMAGVIRDLLHNPRERERLGRAARRAFEACFTRSALLPRYAEVVSSVCCNPRSKST